MKREIVIHIRLPRALRKRWLAASAAALLMAGAVAYAAATWPASHTSGTKISSSDIDGYLNDLNTRVSALSPIVPTWMPLTGANGWTSHGGGFGVPAAAKTPDGRVQLRGMFAGGTLTNGTPVTTLPAGFAPSSILEFPVDANPQASTLAVVDIDTNGVVKIYGAATNGFLGLDGISFFTN